MADDTHAFAPLYPGSLTDVPGIEVGQHSLTARPSGCTVVLAREGAVAGVDVRGAAPGTRETDLLDPSHLIERIHAVLLAGGSAWGLDAAAGVMRWLDEQGIGLAVGSAPGQRVPLVPAAVLFDLHLGDARLRPDAATGYQASQNASRAPVLQGNVGAGTGATVGKMFGLACAMKGGLGSASLCVGGVSVGALVAVNALGDVLNHENGQTLAGARSPNGLCLRHTAQALLAGDTAQPVLAGSNTTVGVIATDAVLTKAQAQRLATVGHDGLARAISPVHTMSDGDTLFALSTGLAGQSSSFNLLAVMAAECVARSCVNAVRAAQSLQLGTLWLPAWRDLGRTPPKLPAST